MLLLVPASRGCERTARQTQFRQAASSARHPHTTFDGLRRPGVAEGSSDNLLARPGRRLPPVGRFFFRPASTHPANLCLMHRLATAGRCGAFGGDHARDHRRQLALGDIEGPRNHGAERQLERDDDAAVFERIHDPAETA
jgi:hypothetical protein